VQTGNGIFMLDGKESSFIVLLACHSPIPIDLIDVVRARYEF
jgi:hypothetical protein